MGAHGEGGTASGKGQNANQELSSVGISALRLSIASRLHYQFQPGLPKEFLLEMAAERNRVALPGVSRGGDSAGGGGAAAAPEGVLMGGMRLPPERFCLTGSGWDLKSEWESEGEEEEAEMEDAPGGASGEGPTGGEEGEEQDEDEEGAGRMEDIFGEDGGEDEDKVMTDV